MCEMEVIRLPAPLTSALLLSPEPGGTFSHLWDGAGDPVSVCVWKMQSPSGMVNAAISVATPSAQASLGSPRPFSRR